MRGWKLCGTLAAVAGLFCAPVVSASNGGEAPSGEPIRIGAIGTYGGHAATTEGPARTAIEAWAEWTNANGGINGRPVELHVEDDEFNATTALAKAKKLIEEDHVVAIVGQASNFVVSWADYAEEQGVPVIGGQSLEVPYLTHANFFPIGTNLVAMNYGLLELAHEYGPKFAVLYCAESPVCAAVVPLLDELGSSLGVEVAYDSSISATATDYTAVCQAIKESGAQSYYIVNQGPVAVRISDECLAQGVTARVLSTNGTVSTEALSSESWSNFSSVQPTFPFIDSSTPATSAFQEAMDLYAPDLGDQLGPYATYAWAAGELFAAAVAASGVEDVTPESVMAGLYALPDGTTLDGLTPPLTFTEGEPSQINCYFRLDAEDGQFVETTGLETRCAPDDLVASIVETLA